MIPAALILGLLVAQQAPSPAPEPIADNSFLVEEAYNQEAHVVQHINVFTRQARSGDWVYSFTQEWPINRRPRHQLSYTLTASSGDPRSGLGDTWLNWRYQVKNSTSVAVAPRLSAILPTGSSTAGRGEGGLGLDVSVPVSIATSAGFVFHSNAGATIIPRAKDETGQTASTASIHVGQSVVWLARPRFNVLAEAVYFRTQAILESPSREWIDVAIVSPGIRWAYNMKSGLQIVPGLALPIELTRKDPSRWTVLGYLSLEHPFGARR